MNGTKKQGRDYGLDLMRVMMTLFVVGIHVLQKGGIYKPCYDHSPKRGGVVILLYFAVACAVNGFALISGYVGIKSKYRLSRIAGLYFTVSFYNILIPLIFHFYRGYVIDETVILRALFPFAYDANWYFTAYLGMFLLIPFLNAAVKHTDKKQCKTAFAALLVFFVLFPTVLNLFFGEHYDRNIFKLSSGYSTLWLSVLYLVGAAIREHDFFRKVPRIAGLACYIASTGAGAFLAALGHYYGGYEVDPLVGYLSPFVVAQALGLLIFFREMKLPGFVCRIIELLAPHSFNIYIMHTQDAVWLMWLAGRYSERVQTTKTIMLPVIFVFFTLSIYGLCLVGDMPLYYAMKLPKLLKHRKAGERSA